ncbi:hypothetical protein HK104_011052 [Borealophlyctis nickersoniae]|nr:hypothetical protein HK104_011052 [Borealophlyctis nickersoniae]
MPKEKKKHEKPHKKWTDAEYAAIKEKRYAHHLGRLLKKFCQCNPATNSAQATKLDAHHGAADQGIDYAQKAREQSTMLDECQKWYDDYKRRSHK